MREISARRFESVRGAQADFDVNGEPGLDALVRDYLGAVPPSATSAQAGDVIIEGGPAAAPDPAP
jgi:general secretion pathway protein D